MYITNNFFGPRFLKHHASPLLARYGYSSVATPRATQTPLKSILIANRGEIALSAAFLPQYSISFDGD